MAFKEIVDDMPDELERPFISQTLAFDVIYDVDKAKMELLYLLSVINLFNICYADKNHF
jgi:hypothetical protein